MSCLDDAFWDALDLAQGNEQNAFPIVKTKLADPSAELEHELQWLHSK